MEEATVQHLVLPSGIAEGADALYTANDIAGSFPVKLEAGEVLDLRAHFNLVPIDRLREYCLIGEIAFVPEIEGKAEVELHIYSEDGTDDVSVHDIAEGTKVPADISKGALLGVVIRAGEGGCTVNGGRFTCLRKSLDDVDLALIVCAYHREQDILDKVRAISSYPYLSELSDHLKVYIVDNGRTLKGDLPPLFTVIPSDNLGGSGGYARGLIEALHDGVSTHAVLNDDDARFEPESLFRILSFYRLVCGNRGSAILGGSMLPKDRPTVVHESGAMYDVAKLRPRHRNTDVSDVDGNLRLSSEEATDYFGWWLCAIPLEDVRKRGLPLPYFFKIDDVEYGLRLAGFGTVNMVGISAWHPSFFDGYSASNVYYETRNLLVTGAVSRRLRREGIKGFVTRMELEVACYRYPTAEAILLAVEDFLKGPEHVFGLCRKGKVKCGEYSYVGRDAALRGLRVIDNAPQCPRWLRKATANGLFLRPRGDIVTGFGDMDTADFYRVGTAVYRRSEEEYAVCRRDRGTSLALLRRIWRAGRLLKRNLKTLTEEYSGSREKYSSEEEWRKLLGMPPAGGKN